MSKSERRKRKRFTLPRGRELMALASRIMEETPAENSYHREAKKISDDFLSGAIAGDSASFTALARLEKIWSLILEARETQLKIALDTLEDD